MNNKKTNLIPGYALSDAQKRMYVLCRLEPHSSYYNMSFIREIIGPLNVLAIKESVNLLINRHEILRTNFRVVNGGPVQIITDQPKKNIIEIIDLSLIKNKLKRKEKYSRLVARVINKPFNLEKDLLIRILLVKIKRGAVSRNNIGSFESHYNLIITLHHIIADGWSMDIFFQELAITYKAIVAGKRPKLENTALQFKDFAAWEQSKDNQKNIKKQEKYWLNKFSGNIPVLSLPTDKPRPTLAAHRGDTEVFALDIKTYKRIMKICKKNKTTLFIFLIACFNILLSKLSGQNDIIIGTPTTNRNREEFKYIFGCFLNTLSVRLRLNNKETFSEYLKKTKKELVECYNNSGYSFERFVDKLNPERNTGRSPIFDVFFQLNIGKPAVQKLNKNLIMRPISHRLTTAQFDLKILANVNGDKLSFIFNYSTDIFSGETIKRWGNYFQVLLQNITIDTDQKISSLQILLPEENYKLMHEFNNTQANYPKTKTLHQLFEAQTRKTPNAAAIKNKDRELSYSELNEKANKLAHRLRALRVSKPDQIIALALDRSPEMIISILAALKAGGAYLPIDPAYPKKRIKYICDNSKASILITSKNHINKMKKIFPANKTVCADNAAEYIDQPLVNLKNIIKPNNLAYVIYTSGSTGKPKGVMVEHRSLINRLDWMRKEYRFNKNDRILQKTTYTFDVSVWELCLWFMSGASVVLLPPGGEKDPERIVEYIEKYKITTIHFVPSMFSEFLAYIENNPVKIKKTKTLKRVFSSGENLSRELAEKFNELIYKRHKTRLYNLYGPTEATIDVTHYTVPTKNIPRKVPIGRPVQNTQVFILDQNMQLLPVGIPGELYLSGDCLARGYLGDIKRTEEVFLSHPFIKGKRIYKTGDMAKMLPDGNIEILGRTDEQIKIRGYRIEPNEIETYFRKIDNINDCAVVKHDEILAAYYTTNNKKPVNIKHIKNSLKINLPDYMIPNRFVYLKKLPLTRNGKLDRKNLLSVKAVGIKNAKHDAPQGPFEEKLAEIWQEILDVKKISRTDNFFNLGGHSLNAIQVSSRINRKFNIKLPFRNIFDNPRLDELSLIIKNLAIDKFIY